MIATHVTSSKSLALLELIPSLTDMMRKAVEARGGLQLVPAQLGCALGQASSASFLKASLPVPGGFEDGLVVRLSGNHALAAPVPVQEAAD